MNSSRLGCRIGICFDLIFYLFILRLYEKMNTCRNTSFRKPHKTCKTNAKAAGEKCGPSKAFSFSEVIVQIGITVISFLICYTISSLVIECADLLSKLYLERSLAEMTTKFIIHLLWYLPLPVVQYIYTFIKFMGIIPEVLLSLVIKDLFLVHSSGISSKIQTVLKK